MNVRSIFCAVTIGTMFQFSVIAQESKVNTELQESKVDTEVKELSGISIIGNQEAPKSLYIVPWQNSEVGMATTLQSGLYDESMRPLSREVFQRELNFYELSHN